ncbi:sterol desaturase family protein [soil metagenome]
MYILLAIPFFFLLMGLEMLVGYLKKKKWYRFNDAVTNLNIGIGQQAFSLLSKALLLGAYIYIQEHWAFFYIAPAVWSFFACLILFDFFFYWAHRWSHEINFFWGAHVVHHSSEEYNLSVALRQSWFHNIIAFVIFLPIPFLGFDPKVFFAAAAVQTLYQFWIHTKAIHQFPKWMEYIFNTPSHHRVHHGINPKYIDKNHAGMFIIWDRMFGTFQAEEEEPTYGITTQLKSWNPAWANFHYYMEMWQSAKRMSSWKDKLRVIFARPGWLPDELGGPLPIPEVKADYKPFDTAVHKGLNWYVAMQFIIITVGLIAFMANFEHISTFYRIVFMGLLLLSGMICGAIFENKRWVIVAEYARLALAALSLNTFYYYQYLDWFSIMLVASIGALLLFIPWFTISWRRWLPTV